MLNSLSINFTAPFHSICYKISLFQGKILHFLYILRTSDGFDVFAHKIVFAAASPALRRALPEQAHDDVCYLILPDFSKQAVV